MMTKEGTRREISYGKCAIWKDHKVVGYIDLTEEQKRILNKVPGIGVYFGFDRTTRPEKYVESYKQT